MGRIKKVSQWILWLLLTPIIIVVTAASLLYIPVIQRWVVDKATAMLSQQTGMDIQMEAVRITFPLDVRLQGLRVNQDTLHIASLDNCVIDLDLSRVWALKGNIDGIVLEKGTLDTHQLIAATRIKGQIGQLSLRTKEVDLKQGLAHIANLCLKESQVDILLADSTTTDTTESAPIPWRIRLQKADILRTRIGLSMPGDTLRINAGIQTLSLREGEADLADGIYTAKRAALRADSLCYTLSTVPDIKGGMDFNHLTFSNISLQLHNTRYRLSDSSLKMRCLLNGLQEKSGFSIGRMSAAVEMDTTHIRVDELDIETPHSTITATANMAFEALKSGHSRNMEVMLHAIIGKKDIEYLTGTMVPTGTFSALPDRPIRADINATGNVDTLRLHRCDLHMPEAIDSRLNGQISHLTNWNKATAWMEWDVQTHNLKFVEKMLGVSGLRLPPMRLSALLQKTQDKYAADALLAAARGRVHLLANLTNPESSQMAYKARLNVNGVDVHQFLPKDSIFTTNMTLSLQGRGTDLLATATRLKAQLDVERLQMRHHNLQQMGLTATLQQGQGVLDAYSNNALLKAHACIEANLNHKNSIANFSLGLDKIDLYALRLSKDTLSASMVMRANGSSNFKDCHEMRGSIEAMELSTKDSVYHPLALTLEALLHPDSVYVRATAGDLNLMACSPEGYKSILRKANTFMQEAIRQKEQYYIDQDTLRGMLPRVQCHISSGKRNPIQNIIRHAMGYTYDNLLFDLEANPDMGLQGAGHLHNIQTGNLRIDTVLWHVEQDTTGVRMSGKVRNNNRNKTVVFESNWFANITPTGVVTGLNYLDDKRRKGIDIGMRVDMTEEGMRCSLTPFNPIIAYRNFTLNEDNFVELTRDGRVEALVDLLADDGTGIKLYSTPDSLSKQDISLNINRLNLGELSMVMPYMPSIQGLMQGDVHYLQTDSTFTLSTDLQVQDMQYDNNPMGNVGVNMVYLPNSDGTHFVDGIVSLNEEEVMYLNGSYHQMETGDSINATATLMHMPMRVMNAFIPDDMARLSGYANGMMEVTGRANSPMLQGYLATDSLHIASDPYSVNLRVSDDTIRVTHSIVNLDRIEAYAIGSNPMVMDGTIDLQNWETIKLDLALAATNYQLINAPKTRTAQAYGKVFVDVNAIMKGTLDNLHMRGRLSVLGNTNVTYVLKDSPISAEDQLDGLVEFADFSDTLEVETKRNIEGQRVSMNFNVNIEQAAQIHCLLSEDGKDYVNLEGGGELTFTYNNQNDMQLFGRYTILGGDMNYSIMELVSKHFDLTRGSYVEFQGDLFNPKLKVAASERVKSTVTEGGAPRTVTFDVGINLSQNLRNMGLEFTLEAPEDMNVQNELASMSAEQRGRVAVTMLATGLFITDNYKSSGVSSTNALYNYMQSQLSAIAGKALSTIDVKFGMENTTDQTGATQTDYNFSFAKRFWGNRLNVIIGGRVSSGENAQNTGESIIDNISLEYRLDGSGTRYVKLYYDKNYESLLEGELTEMGAGAVFRRKSTRLGDLFIFRKNKKKKQE